MNLWVYEIFSFYVNEFNIFFVQCCHLNPFLYIQIFSSIEIYKTKCMSNSVSIQFMNNFFQYLVY